MAIASAFLILSAAGYAGAATGKGAIRGISL